MATVGMERVSACQGHLVAWEETKRNKSDSQRVAEKTEAKRLKQVAKRAKAANLKREAEASNSFRWDSKSESHGQAMLRENKEPKNIVDLNSGSTKNQILQEPKNIADLNLGSAKNQILQEPKKAEAARLKEEADIATRRLKA